MRLWEYTLEGNCSSLKVSNMTHDPSDGEVMYRVKLSPPGDGLFTRDELQAMLVLLTSVLKDETP